MAGRLPRLTFPAREPGARKIMADGLQVGTALASYSGKGWTAHLWRERCDPHMGCVGDVKAASLALLRAGVRARLDVLGPWWTVPGGGPAVAGSETATTREEAADAP
jgi:hypothetical protein